MRKPIWRYPMAHQREFAQGMTSSARNLAVLFADVSGSTKLYEKLGDRAALAAVEAFLDAFPTRRDVCLLTTVVTLKKHVPTPPGRRSSGGA